MARLLMTAAVLFCVLSRCLSQESDPDTLQDVSTQGLFDQLAVSALPGSSAQLRLDAAEGIRYARMMLSNPDYALGYVRSADQSIPERAWAMLRGEVWCIAVGDIVIDRSLGTLTSASRGMGRSTLAPIRLGMRSMLSGTEMHSPFRAGVGGLRGAGASIRFDSSRAILLVAGRPAQGTDDRVLLVSADQEMLGGVGSLSTLVHLTPLGYRTSVSGSLITRIASADVAAEVALDGMGQSAAQAVVSQRSATRSASLSLWWADAQCDLPMGSMLASSDAVRNTWGGCLRLRATQRGLATFRLSVALSGRPWRSWLLPMATKTIDIVGDVEQRVTPRLHVEWRIRHRQDEDGISAVQREQHERILWMLRIRLRRSVHDRLEIRCNADLRLMHRASAPFTSGSLGWVDARWSVGSSAVVRGRLSVFASEQFDVAPTMVEYAAGGLQTLTYATGFGRRASVGIEWTVGPAMVVALQASIDSRLRYGQHSTAGELRIGCGLQIDREEVLTGVTSREGDMHPPRE
ncbi:MAG: hypothetical protein FGM32_02125 [Candidatus Kapabacteria bacterium]|nr:hypothetical protein [Candidatus Kapabacteria bacterium]